MLLRARVSVLDRPGALLAMAKVIADIRRQHRRHRGARHRGRASRRRPAHRTAQQRAVRSSPQELARRPARRCSTSARPCRSPDSAADLDLLDSQSRRTRSEALATRRRRWRHRSGAPTGRRSRCPVTAAVSTPLDAGRAASRCRTGMPEPLGPLPRRGIGAGHATNATIRGRRGPSVGATTTSTSAGSTGPMFLAGRAGAPAARHRARRTLSIVRAAA